MVSASPCIEDNGPDGFADPTELENGIADLIVAGGILTKQIIDRF